MVFVLVADFPNAEIFEAYNLHPDHHAVAAPLVRSLEKYGPRSRIARDRCRGRVDGDVGRYDHCGPCRTPGTHS